jgi:hypothetical protein
MVAPVISQTVPDAVAGRSLRSCGEVVLTHLSAPPPLPPLRGGAPEVLPLQQLRRCPAGKFVYSKDLAAKFVLLKDLHARICIVYDAKTISGLLNISFQGTCG